MLRLNWRARGCAVALLLLALGLTATANAAPAPVLRDPYPRAAAAYATMVDGALLWGRNLDKHQAPASLTKLLTALVLLDSKWSPDAIVSVSHEAAHINRSRVGFHTGDSVRAEAALTAMLMYSANDACMVLVQSASPSLATFAQRMNERALALGMRESHFVHPCGFDQEGQYTTARDLLRLALAAHSNPTIAHIVSQPQASISTFKGRLLAFNNTNHLLGSLDGVIGLKTGYTAQAGKCLIAVAEQEGHRVWLVLLDSHQRWGTAHRIILDAFAAAARGPHPEGTARS